MKANSPWNIAGASARGTSHRKHNLRCQDAFACESINDDWIVLAVADGAGSAALSDIGSRIAVQAAIGSLREECEAPESGTLATEDNLHAALLKTAKKTFDAVVETARQVRCLPRELASTLIVVVAGPTTTAALHIGDGAVVIEAVDGSLVTLSKPDAGEFMGESTFLVSPNGLARARVTFAPGARSIALFSDGIQMLTLQYPLWEPFEPFFRQTFSFMSSMRNAGATHHLESFVASDKLASRTDDDITLVLACQNLPLPAPLPVSRPDLAPVVAIVAEVTPSAAPAAAAAVAAAAAAAAVPAQAHVTEFVV